MPLPRAQTNLHPLRFPTLAHERSQGGTRAGNGRYGGNDAKSLFRNSACVGERVATAPGITRKHPDQLVASTSLAKRRLQLNKRSTVLPLRSCSSRAPCTRAMNSETAS